MSRVEHVNRSSTSNLLQAKKNGRESSKVLPSLQQQQKDDKKQQELDRDSILQTWEEIEQIRRENKELREEIETETRMNHLNGPVLEAKMEQIQDVSSAIAQKIEIESMKKRDLETLISISQDNITQNLKKLNQDKGEALPQLQMKIKNLEYRLEKTRSKHNESLAEINMLKEEVNMARRERVIFSNVFKKLESDIKLKDEEFKKYMIEKMHVAEKKQALEEDLASIKERAKKEVQNFKQEYQAIFNQKQQLENNNNSTSQFDNNNNEYSMSNKRIFDTEVVLQNETISRQQQQQQSQQNAYPSVLQGTLDTTQLNKSGVLNKSTLAQTANQNNHQQDLEATQDQLQKYQFMFQKVQKEVGIEDLDQLIYLFENIEKENNELYESANQKSDEIDDLEKKIKEVEKEIARYTKHKDHKQNTNVQQDKHQQEIARLQKRIEMTQKNTQAVDADIQTVQGKLSKIASKFNIKAPSEDDPDANNFIGFLKNVEVRINDIINMTLFSEGKVVNIDRHRDTQPTMTSVNKKENHEISVVLDGVKKKSDSEAERILNKQDFSLSCQEEIKQFKDSKGRATHSKGKKQKL